MSGAIVTLLGNFASSGGGGGSALMVSLSRTALAGANTIIPGTAQTRFPTTATISGGKPPYSGVWTYVSGDSEIYITSASATTYFSTYFSTQGVRTAIWKYVVTDADSTVLDSPEVSITLNGVYNVE